MRYQRHIFAEWRVVVQDDPQGGEEAEPGERRQARVGDVGARRRVRLHHLQVGRQPDNPGRQRILSSDY